MLRCDAHITRRDVQHALHHESRDDEQRARQRHLADHEHSARATETERRRAARLVLEDITDAHARRLTSGRESGRYRGEPDECGRECEHAAIDLDAHPERELEAERRVEHGDAGPRERESEQAARNGNGERLDEQLPDETRGDAPSAMRTAISRLRDTARASSRFATFAQAMSSTNDTTTSIARKMMRALRGIISS